MRSQINQKPSLSRIFFWPFKSYIRILVVVIIIGLYQYQSIQMDILARDLRALELKRNQLINQKNTLQVQIDQLTHINRIEALAREKFGLVAPGRELEQLVIKDYEHFQKFALQKEQQTVKLAGVK